MKSRKNDKGKNDFFYPRNLQSKEMYKSKTPCKFWNHKKSQILQLISMQGISFK